MAEVKINLANMTVRIEGVYDTLREYCKEYIATDEKTEDFSIVITPADIQRERENGEYERNSDNYIEIIMALLKVADELPL